MTSFFRRTVRRFVDVRALRVSGMRFYTRSSLLTRLVSCLSGNFDREFIAVAHGRLRHLHSMEGTGPVGAMYTLRRNTHRLEKALIMRPRRRIFFRDVIEETVECYRRLSEATVAATCDQELLVWAADVLGAYFEAIEPGRDHVIDGARETFSRIQVDSCLDRAPKVPFQRSTDPLSITIEDMHALAMRRRSCRWYKDKPVPRDIIDRAMEVASLSPSACNRQPFHFRIMDDPELARDVGAIPMGTRGFSQNFQCLAVIIGDLSAFPGIADRHVIYIDAALAAMAFQFALEVQGVGSCCLNWPDFALQEKLMRDRLNLGPTQRVVMCMSFGYPDETGSVPYSQKKPLDDIRSYFRDDR